MSTRWVMWSISPRNYPGTLIRLRRLGKPNFFFLFSNPCGWENESSGLPRPSILVIESLLHIHFRTYVAINGSLYWMFVKFFVFNAFSSLTLLSKRVEDAYTVVEIHRRRSTFKSTCQWIEPVTTACEVHEDVAHVSAMPQRRMSLVVPFIY